MDAGAPLVRLREVRLPAPERGSLTAAFSLELFPGQAVAVSGSARTGAALIRACLGLATVPAGEVEVLGVRPESAQAVELARLREEVGTVLDPHGLVSNTSLRQNLLLPLLFSHRPMDGEPGRRVDELLRELDLTDRADERPDAAGPGACERAAVGRALARRPRLLLLENLDAALTPREIRAVMALCREEIGTILATATDPGASTSALCDFLVDLSAS